MTLIRATVSWERGEQPFLDKKYSRRHSWRFDGGLEIAASSSPANVPVPYSDPTAIDPEEALAAAVSSCHMLWFLALAAKSKFAVDHNHDEPTGEMGKNDAGKTYVSHVTLRPQVAFSGERQPTPAEIAALHHAAHEECFIANSIRAEVTIEGA